VAVLLGRPEPQAGQASLVMTVPFPEGQRDIIHEHHEVAFPASITYAALTSAELTGGYKYTFDHLSLRQNMTTGSLKLAIQFFKTIIIK
jgi:hypothetical protein